MIIFPFFWIINDYIIKWNQTAINIIYIHTNNQQNNQGLPNNTPFIFVSTPGHSAPANFFAKTEINFPRFLYNLHENNDRVLSEDFSNNSYNISDDVSSLIISASGLGILISLKFGEN